MLICLALLAFGVAFITTPALARFLTTRNLTDQPDGYRKLHRRAVPRLGGVAVFAALLLSAVAALWSSAVSVPGVLTTLLLRIAPGLAIVFILGLVDDLSSLPARHKLLFQVLAASVAVALGIRFGGNATSSVPAVLVQALLTIFWIVLCTNAFNLIDGMDGLAAGLGLILAVTIAVAAGHFQQWEVLFIGLVFAAALLGFLRHNFHPASIFLGDSGSLVIGFLLSCLAVVWSNQQNTLTGKFAPAVAFGVPLADVVLSISRRYLAGRPIFSPDRDHVHHRLLRSGLRERNAALALYGAAGLCSLAALVCAEFSTAAGIAAVAILACGALLFTRRLEYAEFRALSLATRSLSLRDGIGAHIILSKFQEAVKTAGDRPHFWTALKQTCFDFGFDHVRLTWAGHVYEEKVLLLPLKDGRTSVSFAIDHEHSLTVSGNFSAEQHRRVLGASAFGAFLEAAFLEMKARTPQLQPTRLPAEVAVSRSASVGAR